MRMKYGQATLFTAFVTVMMTTTAPAAINGADDVTNPAYDPLSGSFPDASNGGTGFGPWTLIGETTDGYAGFFAGAPDGVDNIGSTTAVGEAVWVSYANKGGGIDKATAYRGFAESLDGPGDSFSLSLENGFVNGSVGFALRNGNVTTTAGDFATDARMQLQFNGGNTTYTLVDGGGELDTGVGFTLFGIDATVRMTGADTYDIDILQYNAINDPSPVLTTITGRTLAGSGTVDSVAIFNQDVETQSDGYFNNLAYNSGLNSGTDTTLNTDYDFGWFAGTGDIGTGFGPWEFANNVSSPSGFAGFFMQSSPGNGVDNVGQPTAQDGSAWAMFSNKGDLMDSATAFRTFDNSLAAAGDSFSVAFENGFIDSGGKLGFTLRNGNTTALTDDYDTDARMQFFFEGGDGNFTLIDGDGELDTGVGFTFFGVEVTVTLTGADTYDLDILRYAEADDPAPVLTSITGRTLAGIGSIDSLALFNRDSFNQSDLFFNRLGIITDAPVELNGDLDGDGFVGITDLNIILAVWNQNVTPGDLLQGDPSGDGFVGITDLNVVLGNWNAGTPPAASAVPEPASLTLLGIGGALMLRRMRLV